MTEVPNIHKYALYYGHIMRHGDGALEKLVVQ